MPLPPPGSPPAGSPSVPPGRTDNDRRMFGLLREIRGAVQFLQSAAEDAVKRATSVDASVQSKNLASDLPVTLKDRIDGVVVPSIDAIETVCKNDVSEFEWCADTVTGIKLQWAQVKDLWPDPALSFAVLQQKLTQAGACMDQIVYGCDTLSLSPRVNDILENLRVGQPLDFEFEFGQELPRNPDLRKRLLLELAQQAGVIDNGVVDVERGVIYKAASSRKQQRWSAIQLLVAVLAAILFLPLALAWVRSLLNQSPIKPQDLKLAVLSAFFIFLGSGAHLAVEALKSAKAQTKPSFQAVNDWILWLHVRQVSLLWGIGYVGLGYVLLSVLSPGLDLKSAFFAGYSIDSVTEVFLGRFEAVVKTQTASLAALAK